MIKKLTCIEFCAGCGGMTLGFHQTNKYKHIALIDNFQAACDTLHLNFPKANIITQDINTMDFKDELFQNLDLACIGSPCQSFSYSGLKKGLDDPRGKVFLTFIEFLEIAKPKAFLIENVMGLVSHENGKTLKKIITEIENLGYYVKYKVLDASQYNVPQKRKRIFIFGNVYNNLYKFPKPSNNIILLKDALNDIKNNTITTIYSENKLKYIKKIPQGGCWVNLPLDDQKEYLGKSFESGGGKRGILRRLSWNDVSLTLLCSPQQKQTERCHPTEDRPLTIKEYSRIQTFPDTYKFSGSITSQYKQIGNAVPVKLAQFMADSIYDFIIMVQNKLDNTSQSESDDSNKSDNTSQSKSDDSNKSDNTSQSELNQYNNKALMNIYKKYDHKLVNVLLNNLNKMDKLFKKIKLQYLTEKLNKEKLDDTKIIFDTICQNMTYDDWIKQEMIRQKDKTINNFIGEYHQTLLGYADGWINLDAKENKEFKDEYSIDLMHTKKKIFVEIKNKYNTMNSSSKKSTVANLLNIKSKIPTSTLIIGIIIPKSDKCLEKKENNILYLYGSKLYELFYNDKNAYACSLDLLKYKLSKFKHIN